MFFMQDESRWRSSRRTTETTVPSHRSINTEFRLPRSRSHRAAFIAWVASLRVGGLASLRNIGWSGVPPRPATTPIIVLRCPGLIISQLILLWALRHLHGPMRIALFSFRLVFRIWKFDTA